MKLSLTRLRSSSLGGRGRGGVVGERVPSIELVSSQDDSFTMKADLFCHFKVIFAAQKNL